MDNKIDFVIAYVDGRDPVWRKKKNHYLGIDDEGDNRDIRFRSWDNLKYWFRGVEKFAPWVNKVYLVTDDQAPDWLNPSYEKLVLVNHSDYIPEKYLPVFSANPIELNLFRIKGLSDKFVFFNDDTFLLSPVKPEQFFKDGLPCDYAIESPFSVHDRVFAHIIANDILVLNETHKRKKSLKLHRKKFYSLAYPRGCMQNLMFKRLRRNRFFGFANDHMPNAILKSVCKAVWEGSYETLDNTCYNRFRNSDDVNQYVFLNYQYANGLFTPYTWKGKRKFIRVKDKNIQNVAEMVATQRYQMICINDVDNLNFEVAKSVINQAWEKVLPDKSKFEK